MDNNFYRVKVFTYIYIYIYQQRIYIQNTVIQEKQNFSVLIVNLSKNPYDIYLQKRIHYC